MQDMAPDQNEISDQDLVEQIVSNSPRARQAQAEIYRRHSQNLYAFFRMKGFNKEDAEDSMQKVFIKFFTTIDSFKGDSQLKTYLYKISKNLYIDIIKSASNRTTSSSDNIEMIIDQLDASRETGESQMTDEEARQCIRNAFREFAEDHRDCAEIVTLAVMEDMPLDQVADWMGKTYAAARKYLSNCRKKLRTVMEPCYQLLAN